MNENTMESAIDAFDDMLNENYGPLAVAGIEFMASRVLSELDPTAYRVFFHDWADAEDIDLDELEDDNDLLGQL